MVNGSYTIRLRAVSLLHFLSTRSHGTYFAVHSICAYVKNK
jgi:hypothetical protein